MMYPGEDYTFDGESVTEYPIAQDGKKIKIPRDDFYKMTDKFEDSIATWLYSRDVQNALNSKSPKVLDRVIGQSAPLIKDQVSIKPTSYRYEDIKGKKYKIPIYKKPVMDPHDYYEPKKSISDRINEFAQNYGGNGPGWINDLPHGDLSWFWDKFRDKNKSQAIAKTNNEPVTSLAQKKQPVSKPTPKPVAKKETPDRFGLTREDYIQAHKSKPVLTPGNKKGDAYYELKKNGEIYKVYTKSGGNNWVDLPEKEFNKLYPIINKTPVKPKSKKVETKKPEPKKEEPIKKVEQPKPIERKQNIYEGSPVYSPGAGTGMGSALVGFANQKGDTTYIKPEDYERFAVPKYGKEFIESKKKKNGGWLEKYK